MKTRTAVALWTLAMLSAANAVALVFTSDHADSPVAQATLVVAVGLAFVGAGLVAWNRRPDNRTGLIMTLVGFTWFLGGLQQADDRVLFTLGLATGDVAFAFLAYLLLSFPTGRLETNGRRAMVAAAFLITTVGRLTWMLFNDGRDDYPGAPRHVLLVRRSDAVSSAIELAVQLIALALIAGTLVLLARRWRRASPPLRRALSPVFVAASATIVILAVYLLLDLVDAPGEDAAWWALVVALLSVPLSFLLGLLRGRLARAGVARLVLDLGEVHAPGELRDALARALGDPSLSVAYNIGDGNYVDVEGRHVDVPDRSSDRVTLVEREGRCIAALIHDPSVSEDPALVEAVTAAAGLALENERRLAQLAESEARNRALLDAIPDLFFRISRDGTYLDVKGSEQDLVLPSDQLLGKKISDVLPDDAAESIMRCANKVLGRRGRVESVEYQLRLGSLNRHFEARIVQSGEDEVLLIVRDISDRKRAQTQLERLQDELRERFDELRRERDFIRDVVQASASFFCVVTPGGRVVRFNRALEEAMGYRDDESVRGRLFWELFAAPEEAGQVRDRLAAVVEGDDSAEHENRWIARNGEEYVVAWSATQIRDAEGRPRILVSGVDVTARKRQEEELRRLYAELEARLEELQASRARIVEAGDVERRRLERNLHDGAQQRLVALSLSLRLAQTRLRESPEEAEKILTSASEELARALEELRELARGIHPAILTDRGLGPALEALATRTPFPVDVEAPPEDPLPKPVEAAAYYVVSEALANVAKYAQASGATVRVSRNDGRAVVEVADDGVGGADPRRGSGLRGLADRVEALDGRLEVESPPGGGTTIRAEIPVG